MRVPAACRVRQASRAAPHKGLGEEARQGSVVDQIALLHSCQVRSLPHPGTGPREPIVRCLQTRLKRHQVCHPPCQPPVPVPKGMDQQQLRMHLGHAACGFRQRSWAARRATGQSTVLKTLHVCSNTKSRRPLKACLGQLHCTIAPRPLIDATQPVTVHLAQQPRSQLGIGTGLRQVLGLRPNQRLELGAVHLRLTPNAAQITQYAAVRARLRFRLGSAGRNIPAWYSPLRHVSLASKQGPMIVLMGNWRRCHRWIRCR